MSEAAELKAHDEDEDTCSTCGRNFRSEKHNLVGEPREHRGGAQARGGKR